MYKIGLGFDAHRLSKGKKLILGGVEIPHTHGLEGHSDADVLTHAICDAILGSIGQGDIGIHFPDSDPAFKDISSLILLTKVTELLKTKGFAIVNIDSIVICEQPKISPHFLDIKCSLSETLKISSDLVNVKATTTEKMGFAGKMEGISAKAAVLVKII